jgi:glycosyltransferase involved in cell wall biosynthesis
MSGIKMQQNKPKITVVTVTYNAEKYLEETIKSVIEQDYPNIEYIIIDGASTDDTIDIIKQYEEHIDYWISEPDRGIYDAMNKAIDLATGEWINFMNAGDSFCEKETLSKVFNLNMFEYDLICGDIYYGEKKLHQIAKGLKFRFKGMFCFHQATFARTDIMKKYKFSTIFDIAADYDFLLKCSVKNYKFKFINVVIANYIGNGISQVQAVKARIEDLFIQSRYLKDLEKIFDSNSLNYLFEKRKKKNLDFTKLFNSFQASIEKLELSNKEFILYGFGNIGKVIYNQYKDSIIKIVDKNFETLSKQENIEICELDTLKEYKDNFILISVLGREEEIRKELAEKYFIEENQILLIDIN